MMGEGTHNKWLLLLLLPVPALPSCLLVVFASREPCAGGILPCWRCCSRQEDGWSPVLGSIPSACREEEAGRRAETVD
jgi:hypothetical protein